RRSSPTGFTKPSAWPWTATPEWCTSGTSAGASMWFRSLGQRVVPTERACSPTSAKNCPDWPDSKRSDATVSYTRTFADINNRPVAVFGAGTLGRRIAWMFASRGGTVRMHDPNAEQVTAATEYVAQTLPEVVNKRGSGEVGLVLGVGSVAEAL